MTSQKRSLIVAVAALLMWLTPATLRAQTAAFEPFTFALLGDPQIGFGPGGEYADAGRFRQVVAEVNRRKVTLTVIPGDLVQDRKILERWLFQWVRDDIERPALLAAGNHDVVDLESLEAYRARFGRDYFDSVVNDCAFVVLNSETARDQNISQQEFEQQWSWLERTLAGHTRAKRRHVALVMHRPPFVEHEQEEASGSNWPLDTRARLLALAREHGVRWFLAGHLHRNVTTVTPDGLHVVVVAGSAHGFDGSPIGFHLFRVASDRLESQWVTVAERPQMYAVPGFREWTPRLFAFSLRHWIFTLAYVAAGAFVLRVARARNADEKQRSTQALWRVIAIVLFAFAVNMQLDIDEFLRECGRIGAKLTGISPVRHLITGSGLLLLVVGCAFFLFRRYRSSRRERSTTIALAMLVIPSAWFVLSAISHHDLEMLFDEMWWDLLMILALVSIVICAQRWRRDHAPMGRSSVRRENR